MPGRELGRSNIILCIVPGDHPNEDGASTSIAKVVKDL